MEDVFNFIQMVCTEGLMEYECIVVDLVYIRRLLKGSKGEFHLYGGNWKDIYLSCCVLSNKMWDDFHMSNADYCIFVEDMTLKRLNELEHALLKLIKYHCNVSERAFSNIHLRIQAGVSPKSTPQISNNQVLNIKTKEGNSLKKAKKISAGSQFFSCIEKSVEDVTDVTQAVHEGILLPSIVVSIHQNEYSQGKLPLFPINNVNCTA